MLFFPPQRITTIDPNRLPRPYATKSIIAIPKTIPGTPTFKTPPGFEVKTFAKGLDKSPRWLAVAPTGDVFVTQSYAGRILVLRDSDGDGVAETQTVFADGLKLPHGMAFQGDWLYVANTDSVVRFAYRPGQTAASGPPETVVNAIPALGRNQHWTRNILFEPDGEHFFLTVGSASNKAVESPPRATITRYRADGTGAETFATGLRNPVGIAFRPGTTELWTTCVERDYMGNDVVPEFLTRVRRGDFFGWPWTYIGDHVDPRAPKGRPKRKATMPDVLFTAHSVPLGLVFATGTGFPEAYRGDAFVAMRGSTNRSVTSGVKIVRVHFDHGRAKNQVQDFVTGWLADAKAHTVYGRPVGLAQWTDGSLLVSDEVGHCIWRIRYAGETAR